MISFTEEEQKLLTPFDATAHDMYVVDERYEGNIPCAWLVMSEKVRVECRTKLMANLRDNFPKFDLVNDEALIEYINIRMTNSSVHQQWIERERILKHAREVEHNPRGFFVEG